MNLRLQRRDEVELNITPLIDVVFLLLIFFMVSTSFERQSEISITLPETSEEYTEVNLDVLHIDIDAQGQVFINNHLLVNTQLSTIREALRDAARDTEDSTVIISADAQATHQLVIRAMDAARQLNLIRIIFATQKIEKELLK